MAKAVDYVSLKPGDFLADEDFQVWDAALCGAYCRILFTLYTNGGYIKSDPDHIRMVANWRGDGWDKAWSKLAPKFSETARGLKHKRVTKELRRAQRRMQARSRAGLAGASARWQTHGKRNADAMPTHRKGREGKGREVKKKKNPLPPSLDTKAFRQAWESWEAYRTEKRKALAPSTRNRQLAKCEKIGQARALAMIEYTIEQGWIGLFEPDSGGKPKIHNIAPGGFRDEPPDPLQI